MTARADMAFCDNRQTSGSAPDVEHRFTSREASQVDEALAEGAISTVCQEPYEQIVTRGPMQDAASCCWPDIG